tara:strand:- start:2344 stop:2508 length:165 start_codon:yes stop_codon:yes gene_type:complete
LKYDNDGVAKAIQKHIYDAENSDWNALEAELLKMGYMDIEVFYIINNVRVEGTV